MYRNKKGQFAHKAFNAFGWFVVTVMLFAGILFAGTRNTQAEYHHCMVTMTDKTICESVRP